MMKNSKWIRGYTAALLLLGVAGCGGDSSGSNANTGASGTGASGTGAGTAAPAAGTTASGAAGTTATGGAAGAKPATAGTGTSGGAGATGAAGGSAGTAARAGTGGSAAAGTGAAGASAGTGAGGAAAGSGGAGGGGAPAAGTGGGMLGGTLMYTGPFTMGMTIDPKYKCPMSVIGGGTGDNKSPPLAWTGGPADTKSFAVVLFDTKFNLLHWAMWDIPASVNMLPEGLPSGYELMNPMGAHQAAMMGSDKHAYYGPCSSGSGAATYEYRLYALKVDKLGLMESSTATQAQMAIESMMLAKTVWTGKPM